MLEKNLTPLYVAEKILSPEAWGKKFTYIPPPAPQKSNVRPLRDVIGENRFHNCANKSKKALLVSV